MKQNDEALFSLFTNFRRDIARTYPEHDFFKKKGGVGQESLFNVMKAYSIHDREVALFMIQLIFF